MNSADECLVCKLITDILDGEADEDLQRQARILQQRLLPEIETETAEV